MQNAILRIDNVMHNKGPSYSFIKGDDKVTASDGAIRRIYGVLKTFFAQARSWTSMRWG